MTLASTKREPSVEETLLLLGLATGVPVYLRGEPGSGKSASVQAIAGALKKQLWTIMLGTREPSDQGGLPAVFEHKGEKLVRLVPPGWAREIRENGGGIVFFDEITTANPSVMNSALRIIQEGVVGDSEPLPAATRYVLAGNPTASNLGSNELTAGMANRCVHVAWGYNYERWRAGMLRAWAAEDVAIQHVPEGWEKTITDTAARYVVGFLDARVGHAHAQPADVDAQGSAWPSGRTWDLTSRMLAAAIAAGHSPKSIVAKAIVLGLVGESAQAEWSSWVANMDLPSTADLLADPSKLPKRQDQVLACLSGVVAYVSQRRGNEKVYMQAWSVVHRALLGDDPGLAIQSCRDLMATDLVPPGADKKTGTPFAEGSALAAKHLRSSGADYGQRR